MLREITLIEEKKVNFITTKMEERLCFIRYISVHDWVLLCFKISTEKNTGGYML